MNKKPLFKIVSALDHNLVLECSPQRKLILGKYHQGLNQKWMHNDNMKGQSQFINNQNKLFMQIDNDNNGTQGSCLQAIGSKKQIWRLQHCNDPQFKGRNAFYFRSHCGKALDVCQGKALQGTHVIQWEFNGNKNQIWILESIGFVAQQNAVYKITTALDRKMALDVSQNPQEKGNMILWPYQNHNNQKFKIHLQKGHWTFTNLLNNDLISVQGDHSCTRVKTTKKGINFNQYFEIMQCDNPQYKGKHAYLIKHRGGKYLDVNKAIAKKQAQIIQYEYHGNKNQIWFITKV